MPKAIENGDASLTRIAEGFSLLRLINDSYQKEESKEPVYLD